MYYFLLHLFFTHPQLTAQRKLWGQQDLIRPPNSEWNSALLLVANKNTAAKRFVIDIGPLNVKCTSRPAPKYVILPHIFHYLIYLNIFEICNIKIDIELLNFLTLLIYIPESRDIK